MSNLVGFTPERALSATITASAGARARFYETGTTTPVVVRDVDNNVLAQPVLANAAGVFPQVTYAGTVAVKAVVTAADESALYTLDPCPLSGIGGSGASSISFTPSTGIAATNVQAAIEEVQGNISANTANAQTLVQTGGASNAYTLTSAETISAYAAGQMFLVRINHQNTGAATLNVDSLGARDWQKYSGGSLAALASGELRVGEDYFTVYDGTRFILLGRERLVTTHGYETLRGQTQATSMGFRVPDAHFAGSYVTGVGILPLTVTRRNVITGSAALASNVVTLQPGTYYVEATASLRAQTNPGGLQTASVALWNNTAGSAVEMVATIRAQSSGDAVIGKRGVYLTVGTATAYGLHFARESSNWEANQPPPQGAHASATQYDHELLVWRLS